MDSAPSGKPGSGVGKKLTILGLVVTFFTGMFGCMDHTAKIFEGSKAAVSFVTSNCSGDSSWFCQMLPSWLLKPDTPLGNRPAKAITFTTENIDLYPEPNDLGLEKLTTLSAGIPIQILDDKTKPQWAKIHAPQQNVTGYVRSSKILGR